MLQASQNPLVRAITNSHYTRVIADGGVIDNKALLSLTIDQLLKLYPSGNFASLKAKLPVTLCPKIFGYKVGTGSGVTVGGFACEKLYSLDSANDAIQTTAANQPLLLRHTGTNYLYAARTSSNGVTGTHALTYNSSTDTLVLTAKIFINNQTTASFDYIISCSSAAILAIANNGTSKILRFRGTANAVNSSAYTPSTTEPHWVRLTSTTTQVIYEWSADGSSWTNIGTQTRPTVGTIGTTCGIGSTGLTNANAMNIYYATIENQTTGATVTFDPAYYNRYYAQTGWKSGNAQWALGVDTVNATGLKSLLVDETTIMGDGVAMKLSIPSVTLSQPATTYTITKRLGTGVIWGKAVGSQLSNDGTNTTLNNGTALNRSDNLRQRQLIITTSNGSSSSIHISHTTANLQTPGFASGITASGDAGSNSGTYLDVLANGASYGNHTIATLLISNAADSTALKRAMFKIFCADNKKTVCVTGDSISYQLITNGMAGLAGTYTAVYKNAGISGSNLAKISYNDPTTWNPFSFIERSKVGAANIIDVSDVDILLVWSGFNDLDDRVPLTTSVNGTEYTIAGAITAGVANYLARNPKMQVVFMNPLNNPLVSANADGVTLAQIATQEKVTCASIVIPCYDMYANCGIDSGNAASILTDSVHPNATYMNDTLAPLAGAFLASL